MIKKFIIFSLLVLSLLLLAVLYLHRGVSREASYVTSGKCRECHASYYDSWRENSLHPYMFLPVTSADAEILGDFDSNDPALTFTKDEIEFVLGRKWEQVYARVIDGEYYPLPAKWYVIEKRWVPYKVEDWRDTPMSYKCNGCHTTGFDPNTLEFSEFGIGCEACHGPGSLHIQQESMQHKQICSPCHRDKGEEKGDSGRNHFIVTSVSPSLCGQCHSRGTTPTGEIIKGRQFNFPAGFKAGDDLRTTDFIPSSPENDKNRKNWWGNGLSKNRHQEFSDLLQSGHGKSLTNLLENINKKSTGCGEPENECLQCHSTDYRHGKEADKPDLMTARFGVTCVACHEPHGYYSKQADPADGTAICTSCHLQETDSDGLPHSPCTNSSTGCADCHMPRIVKTGGFFSLHSHAFRIVPPAASRGNNMPNSCQNGGCHVDRDLEWAMEAYEEFYGYESRAAERKR